MLTWVLAGLFLVGLVYGLMPSAGRSGRVIPKSRFKNAAHPEKETFNNERVFETMKRSSQKAKIDYAVFAKDSVVRDLYWAGIRSQTAVRIIPLFLNLVALVPLLILGFLYAVNPPSTNTMAMIVASGGAGYKLLRGFIQGKKKERQAAIEKDLPQFLDLLVVCVEAGQNFPSAIQTLSQELDPKRPLIEEFIVMNQEYLGGVAMQEACSRLTQRCGVDNLSAIVGNIVQSERIGSSLGQTLRILAHEMRDKRRAHLRELANQMGVKVMLPCIMILASLMCVLIGPAVVKIFAMFE